MSIVKMELIFLAGEEDETKVAFMAAMLLFVSNVLISNHSTSQLAVMAGWKSTIMSEIRSFV